jgi:hypothetical protein
MAELRPSKRAREDDTGGVSETEEQSSRRAPVVVFAHGAGGNSSHEWMVRSGSYTFVFFSSALLLSNCEMLSLLFFSSVSFFISFRSLSGYLLSISSVAVTPFFPMIADASETLWVHYLKP